MLTNRNDYSHGVFHLTRKKLKNKQMKTKYFFFILLFVSSCAPSKEDFRTNPTSHEKYIIVTADDYGASININKGICQAAENDIITTISVLTNFKESINNLNSFSEKYPSIGIGVHLNITTGKPLTSPELIPSMVNEQGNFYTISELLPRLTGISTSELKTELRAQVQVLADNGIRIDHLSNQHGILSSYSPFYEVLIDLAKEYNLPVRSNVLASMKYPEVFPNSFMHQEGYRIFRSFAIAHPLKALAYSNDFNVRDYNYAMSKLDNAQVTHPDLLIDYFYGNPTETNLTFILNHLPPGINEIVLHLGTQDRQQEYPSGLNLDYFSNREQELKTMTTCNFNDHLHQMSIKKINYSEIDRIATLHVSNQTDPD